ncbi:hypothetical protein [Litorisediminicola beolgyonensis]|uniref:Uncharacterized protein n=1 Tax=Litorisediminicola beolgyonensis TaxID=1173614 RepID=A0ABW3ZLP9_9RHOB
MKRLLTLMIMAPGAALAHGVHGPVPAEAHGLAHAGPVLAVLVIAGAAGLALKQRRWRP